MLYPFYKKSLSSFNINNIEFKLKFDVGMENLPESFASRCKLTSKIIPL